MSEFKKIQAESLQGNPFEMIGKEWMLVSAGNEQKANSMTASWGYMGVMWGKNVVGIVIRESRFTKEFIDREGKFSLTFLGEENREMLRYLGSVSGRNEDKMTKAGVQVAFEKGVPYVEQGRLAMICRVMSATKITTDNFLDDEIASKWYADGDLHTLYIAEIEEILTK